MQFRVKATTVMNFRIVGSCLVDNTEKIPKVAVGNWRTLTGAYEMRSLWAKCLKGRWELSVESEQLDQVS